MARKRKGRPVHGWVVVDKPPGVGSTPAVGQVRRYFNAQKAGHAGTLDPFASGVLPVALGEATKTVPYVAEDGLKTYRFTVAWAVETDTLDSDGAVTGTSGVRPGDDEIRATLPAFEGVTLQRPPDYSAVKVDGQRAYALARRGEAVELAAREVEIVSLAYTGRPDDDHAEFEMTCGAGTYVRAFARDLAERLGAKAHVSALRRTRVGPFGEEQAIPLSEFSLEAGEQVTHNPPREGVILPLQAALVGIPALAVNEAEAMRLRNGQAVSLLRKVDLDRVRELEQGEVVLATRAGVAVALAHFGRGEIRPFRVFNM